MLVPVQCCCEPGKRLGWLELPPEKVRAGEQLRFVTFEAPATRVGEYLPPRVQATVLETEVRWHQRLAYPARLLDCGHYTVPIIVKRLAVSSHDHALEEWTRVRAFAPIVDNNSRTA